MTDTPTEPMSFGDALCHLKDGRKVRRRAWARTYYAYIDARYPDRIVYMNFSDRFSDEDLLAEDWEAL